MQKSNQNNPSRPPRARAKPSGSSENLRERGEQIDPERFKHLTTKKNESSTGTRMSGIHLDYSRQGDPSNFGGYGGGQTGSPAADAFPMRQTIVPGPGHTGGRVRPRERRSENVRPDREIEDDIRAQVAADPDIDADEVTIDVHDGIVTLTGETAVRSTKHAIEDIVDETAGVRGIENRIHITRAM